MGFAVGVTAALLVSVMLAQLPFAESGVALRGSTRDTIVHPRRRHLLAWRMQDSIITDGQNFPVPNGMKMLKGTIPHIRRQNELIGRYKAQHQRLETVMPIVNVITKAVVEDENFKNAENHYIRTTGAREYGFKETGVDVEDRHAHVAAAVGARFKPMLMRKNHHRVKGINFGGNQLKIMYSDQAAMTARDARDRKLTG